MKNGRVFIDSFSSGLDDLTVKQASDYGVVLQVLERTKRFSAFEASANQAIAKTITQLFKLGLVKDLGGGYPWSNVELTDAGRAAIGKEPAK